MLQRLQTPSQTTQVDIEEDVTTDAMECSKENRVVFHAANLNSKTSPPRKTHRTPPKQVATNHALQSMKRMREHDNAVSSKIIQNLQNDKVAFAQKLEEMQGTLTSTKQRCVALESSANRLVAENEKLEDSNNALQQEIQELHETANHQASTISQLEAELQQERAKAGSANPTEAELLHIAKRYLKQTLQLQRATREQIKPISKSAWQLDSLVAQCNGCSKRFGTFLRRHHCRGCGKLFCSACCHDTLQLQGEAEDTGVLSVIDEMAHLRTSEEQKGPFRGQRSCKDCFKLVEETATKKRHLQEQSRAELRAMEEWLSRPEVDLDALLAD